MDRYTLVMERGKDAEMFFDRRNSMSQMLNVIQWELIRAENEESLLKD